MMTSSNWKMVVTFRKENFLSYNILKFGRKSTKDERDTHDWIQNLWRHTWKFEFFILNANMMTSQSLIVNFDASNHICNSYAFRLYHKKWGYPRILRSYKRLKVGFILPYFDCMWPLTHARILMFGARVRPYYCTKMIANGCKLKIMVSETQNKWKNEISGVRTCCARGKRAHGRIRAEIFEMLKMVWNVSKTISRSIGPFWNFDARACARHDARAVLRDAIW